MTKNLFNYSFNYDLKNTNFASLIGELSEWFKEHAWKACISQGIKSSNLLLSAKKTG